MKAGQPEIWAKPDDLAGLPGMPATARGVRMRLASEKSRKSPHHRGREYFVADLPRETQLALLARSGAAVAARREAPTEQSRDGLADWQRGTEMARMLVCRRIDALMLEGMTQLVAIETLLSSVIDGSADAELVAMLGLANARRRSDVSAPSRGTLYRWMAQRSAGGCDLAPSAPPRQAVPIWLPGILQLYQNPNKLSIAECVRDFTEKHPEIPAPSARTVARHLEQLPVEVRNFGRMGRAKLRSVQPFVRRTIDGLWPMDVVTVDGHLFKAYTRHPLNANLKIRPEITTYVDISTRKIIGFSAWVAESQHAIWTALRGVILNDELGVPAIHYSDNGAYRSDQHLAMLDRLGVTASFSQAYRAQSRGVIERLNSSVWIPLAKKFPAYVGDDVDRESVKKQLKIANSSAENLPAWNEFIDVCLEAIQIYNNSAHSTLKGASPNDAWNKALSEGWKPTKFGEGSVHDLLPSVSRTVDRGWVRLPWGHYFADQLRHHHGRSVVVGIEPTDGRQVWVSDASGVLLCTALRDGNSRPYYSETMLENARARREAGKIRRLDQKAAAARAEVPAIEQADAEFLSIFDDVVLDIASFKLKKQEV